MNETETIESDFFSGKELPAHEESSSTCRPVPQNCHDPYPESPDSNKQTQSKKALIQPHPKMGNYYRTL